MQQMAWAILENGERLPYIERTDPARGGMKHTYFAPDRSYVVQFFNHPSMGLDPNIKARLSAILTRYNPTLSEEAGGAIGNTEKTAAYFKNSFCWPLALVKSPEFGIVCPCYPENYFFDGNASTILNLKGKDKKSNWFTSLKTRQYLQKAELGDFRSMLRLSIMLARSIRRLHQAGLAHSDLSNNNVLIDPKSGACVVIDIDSLVAPGIFPPEVIGTRGYMAPEVLEGALYPFGHPQRKLPSTLTDLHALPVLLYEYLFHRHPLLGPKIYSDRSAEEDDFLALGPMATFIEHPSDQTNRPQDLKTGIGALGPILEKLFLRAFADGLHQPEERPTAMEWERGLYKTWDLLHPCQNPACEQKWFVLYDPANPVCPFCKTRLRREDVVRLSLCTETHGAKGQWLFHTEVDVSAETPLYAWHLFGNQFPDEKADRKRMAYIRKTQRGFLLVNEAAPRMVGPRGESVMPGMGVPISDGDMIRLSSGGRGFLAKISIKRV